MIKNLLSIAMIASTLFVGASPSLGQQSAFGRFTGYLSHSKTDRDQLAKIDFVLSREAGNELRLKAILTLHFGDFGSSEYVAYHYDDVKYNVVTGELVFDQVGQDLTLTTETIQNGELVAKVRSVSSGDVGKLILSNNGTAVQTDRALVEPLEGEYRGLCDNTETRLHLNTYRATTDNSRIGNPFATYEVTGRLGQKDNVLCPNPWGRLCVINLIYAGSYNFFEGRLQLFGRQRSFNCSVAGDTLQCGECRLQRSSAAFSTPPRMTPKVHQNSLPEVPERGGLIGSPQGVAGEYRGYIHHEFLNQYQPVWLNLVTYQDPSDDESFRISAAARISFGEEVLPYQFNQTTYRLLSPVIVLSEAHENVDALIQITELRDGTVKGIWHSILFGRVGEFVVTKDREIDLPGEAKIMGDPRGDFLNEQWKVNLTTRLAEAFSNTTNPFHPITFGGYLWYRTAIAPRIDFVGGSYDFYTGKIGIITEDDTRIATGTYDLSNGDLRLHWPAKKFGTLMSEWEPAGITRTTP